MSTAIARFSFARTRCHWRPIIMAGAAVGLLGVFWFASRYPQLFSKAEHVGDTLPSMAYSSQVMTVAADAPVWRRILAATINWLDSMKIGMTFGVLFGALLHTILRYYPLKIGKNLYLNSLKGALVGVPGGVCANCAVPVACGVTRGHGRVEVALGFLFSSPNFNPVVVMMTFMALPLAISLTKYAILLLVILVVVPSLIRWLERDKPLPVFAVGDEGGSCAIKLPPTEDCQEQFTTVFGELARDFRKHVWMLLKPTITLMLLASVQAKLGMTPNLMKTLAAGPAALEAYLNFGAALGTGKLDAKFREQIALAVAQANSCEYCLSAHSAIGKMVGLKPEEIAASREAHSADAKRDAGLHFVQALVVQRGMVSDQDVATVKAAGYTDGDIAELVANAAINIFTNYFNHVARTDVDFPPVSVAMETTVA